MQLNMKAAGDWPKVHLRSHEHFTMYIRGDYVYYMEYKCTAGAYIIFMVILTPYMCWPPILDSVHVWFCSVQGSLFT